MKGEACLKSPPSAGPGMSYDGQIPGISVCVSAAGGGIPISIFLPFPRSPEGFLPGYLFIAPAGCRPPAAGLKMQPWGKGRAVNSRFFPPSLSSRCFPKSEARWEKGAVVLALEGLELSKEVVGWSLGRGHSFGDVPQWVTALAGQSQSHRVCHER